MDHVITMAAERPVVIFSKSTCPMSFTVESLFLEFGVNPSIHNLDQLPSGWGHEIENALTRLGCNPTVPTIFIGGKLVGGTNEVMSLHLKRSLIPMLKRVGALWV